MLDENTQLKLLRGSDVRIDSEIVIKSYTINQIIDEIGMDKYNRYVGYLANSPYDLRGQLYENGIIYTDVSQWNLFMSYFSNINKTEIRESILTLLSIDIFNYTLTYENNGEPILISYSGNKLDSMKFKHILNIIREINGYPNIDKEPKFGNKQSLVYEVERHIRRMKKGRMLNGDVTLKSIISSIAWSDSGIGLSNIWDLTLYQLYDGLNRKVKKERYDNLMIGVYTGNIVSDSINFNKENWITN